MSNLMEKVHVGKNGVIFEIDGETSWESSRRIALPKYILRGANKDNIVLSWREFIDKNQTLSENFRFSERLQSRVIEIDLHDADFILNPRQTLHKFIEGSVQNELSEKIVRLCTILEHLGIKSEYIGIGGSNLTGLATATSDIDLLVYGERNKLTLLSNSKILFAQDGIKTILTNDEAFNQLYDARKRYKFFRDEYNATSFITSEKRRIQGVIGGTRFVFGFIREREPNDLKRIERIEPISPVKIEGTVLSDNMPFEPLRMHLRIEKVMPNESGKDANFITDYSRIDCIAYNPIYAIQYFAGETVEVSGMLENVITSDKRSHYQIGIRYHNDISKEILLTKSRGTSLW